MAFVRSVASSPFESGHPSGRQAQSRWHGIGRRFWCCSLVVALALPLFWRGDVEAKLSVEDYAIIGETLHAIEMDEWPRALRLMGSIDDELATKLFRWITLVENRGGEDFDGLSTFIINNPDWPRIDDLQRIAEARLTDSADKGLTSDLFRQLEPASTRGRIRFAEALFIQGSTEEAVQQVRRAWIHGDFSAREEKVFLGRHKQHLRPGDHSARLEQLLWDRKWRDANRMFPRVSAAYGKLAKARLALQKQAGGVDRTIEAVPPELADDPGLLFDRIRWRRLKRKHEDAKQLLLDPPDRLVRPERWWFERSYHIRRSIEARRFDEAYRLASRHGQLSGGDYAEAEWLSGWLALRFLKRPKTGFRHFVRLYDRVSAPVRQARAAYWAGRAAVAQHDEAGAVAWYRRAAMHGASYYGQLAQVELKGEVGAAPVTTATETERAAFEAKEVAAVARMLIAVGDRRYLDDFLSKLAADATTSAEIGIIADYAKAAGRPILLARLGRTAAFEGKVHEQTAFPIPKIEGLLRPVAAVEPSLLLGLARQESMFRSDAASTAGARGLMQLIPSTARIVARKTEAPYDRDRLLADPEYNAFLGAHYLESLIERFDGAVPLALAGYNAGPLRVKKWLERHGDPRNGDRHAMVDWIELIPFEETRNYVQRVLEGHGVYKRRLADADVELIDYPGINLLHPPPVPVARPVGDGQAIRVTRSEETDLAEVHRPRLKPLYPRAPRKTAAEETKPGPTVERSFDDEHNRALAADEGGGATTETVETAPQL